MRRILKLLLKRFEAAYEEEIACGSSYGLLGYAETFRYRLEDIPEDEFIEILDSLRDYAKRKKL